MSSFTFSKIFHLASSESLPGWFWPQGLMFDTHGVTHCFYNGHDPHPLSKKYFTSQPLTLSILHGIVPTTLCNITSFISVQSCINFSPRSSIDGRWVRLLSKAASSTSQSSSLELNSGLCGGQSVHENNVSSSLNHSGKEKNPLKQKPGHLVTSLKPDLQISGNGIGGLFKLRWWMLIFPPFVRILWLTAFPYIRCAYRDVAIIEKKCFQLERVGHYMSLKEEVNPNHSRQKNVPSSVTFHMSPFVVSYRNMYKEEFNI